MIMWGKKRKALLGLDIGSQHVKVAELQEGPTGFILKNFGLAQLPPFAFQEGSIRDPGIISKTIQALMANMMIKNKHTAVSISGHSVIVKRIQVPPMPPEDLKASLYREAEQYIPFDPAEVYMDFETVPNQKEVSEKMEVLLVAAKKDIVQHYVNLLSEAGLIPALVDVDAFAITNAFALNYPEEEGPVALVDIGASKMNIHVVRNHVPIFSRDAFLGGRQLTEGIQSRFNLGFDEAECIKLGAELKKEQLAELESLALPLINNWAKEIKRALDFLSATQPEQAARKVFLSGGSSRLPGFSHLINQESQIPVFELNPFTRLKYDPDKIHPEYLQAVAPQAVIAVGLGIRSLEGK
jgi:type IV pilus assembly protein PilM